MQNGSLVGAVIALALSFQTCAAKTENVYLWNVNKDYRNCGYVHSGSGNQIYFCGTARGLFRRPSDRTGRGS